MGAAMSTILFANGRPRPYGPAVRSLRRDVLSKSGCWAKDVTGVGPEAVYRT
jgi:hypothetical protein